VKLISIKLETKSGKVEIKPEEPIPFTSERMDALIKNLAKAFD